MRRAMRENVPRLLIASIDRYLHQDMRSVGIPEVDTFPQHSFVF